MVGEAVGEAGGEGEREGGIWKEGIRGGESFPLLSAGALSFRRKSTVRVMLAAVPAASSGIAEKAGTVDNAAHREDDRVGWAFPVEGLLTGLFEAG